MAKTISIQKVEAQLAYVRECLSAPDRQRGAHVDRGPVEYARIRKQYIAAGEARLEMLERAQAAAARQDLQKREQVQEAREAKQAVCPVCFCSHPGEC
jgi:hypothetical protein